MVRRPSCLIPDLTGVSFTIQCDVSCVFVIHGLYYVEVHFSLSTLLRVLGTNKFWIIWDAFPALLIWSWFLPLLFFFVVHFKNIFHRIYFRERERVGRRYKKRERILTNWDTHMPHHAFSVCFVTVIDMQMLNHPPWIS